MFAPLLFTMKSILDNVDEPADEQAMFLDLVLRTPEELERIGKTLQVTTDVYLKAMEYLSDADKKVH